MKKADRIFAFISLALSCWLVIESLNYDYTTDYTPGPGFLPFWLGICLGLLSLFLLFDSLRRGDAKGEGKETKMPAGKALLRLGLILLITAGLVFFMMKIGFVLAAFVFIALILIVLEKYPIVKGVLYSILLSGALFLIFRYWLNVDLPKGWWGL